MLLAAADPITIPCRVLFVAAAVDDQAGTASTAAMAHVSAALSGASAFPGGVAGLPGMSAMPGIPGLGVPAAVTAGAATAANKVMRELHVGGLPHGVSGVQLQASDAVCVCAPPPACPDVCGWVARESWAPRCLLASFLPPLRGDFSSFL